MADSVKHRQLHGPIRGQGRNSTLAPTGIVDGVPPNRAARRWYQKTITRRSDRLHLVLFGGWRKHDTTQQKRHQGALLAGQNKPTDGLTRRERRAEHSEIYRAWRKSASRRTTRGQ